MPRKTPAKSRAEFAEARVKGKLAGSALIDLQRRFMTLRSAGDFIEWRKHPLTVLFIDAMREMAVNPPPGYLAADSNVALEYGLTSGLTLAASLMDDPSSVYSYLFSAATPGAESAVPDTTYSVAPDEAILRPAERQ